MDKSDKNIEGKSPKNAEEIMYLLINTMPLDRLQAHLTELNRTRKKAILYTFNGRGAVIPRRKARDAAKDRLSVKLKAIS